MRNHLEIQKKLEEIEAEMHRIGYWKKGELDFDLSECQEAFCADKLVFSGWLQYVFLPAVRGALETNNLPAESMVGAQAMREYNYMSIVEEALPLANLLTEFDSIINGDQ